MPMPNEETLRLILETSGFKSIDEATESLKRLKAETGGLSDEQQKALNHLELYKNVMQDVGKGEQVYADLLLEEAQDRRIANEMLAEATEAHKALETSVTSTHTATGNMGQGVLQASYAVQDFTSVLTGGGGLTRALGAVQNNIPVLLSGLGMGAGLAGTVSLVSVGLGALIPLLSQMGSEAEDAGKKAKKAADEVERLKGMRTSGQEATGARVEALLKESPASIVEQGISQTIYANAQRQAARAIEEEFNETGTVSHSVEDYIGRGPDGQFTGAWAGQVTADLNTMMLGLKTDPSARARVAQMARARPQNFPKNFAADLAATEPEAFAAAETAADEEMIRTVSFGERAHDAGVRRRAQHRKNRLEMEAKNKRVVAAQKVEDAGIIQQADIDWESDPANPKNVARAAALAKHNAATQAREAKQAAEAANRAKDPSNQLNAITQQTQDAVGAQVLGFARQGAFPQGTDLRALASQAVRDLPNQGGNIAAAIQQAAMEGYWKAQADIARHMNPMANFGNQSRIGY